MLRFRDFPIKIKLALTIMATTFGALAVACGIFVVKDRAATRSGMVNHLTILTETLASNCASAVSFDDDKAATEALASLKVDPHIESAVIVKTDGKTFASYSANGTPVVAEAAPADGFSFTDNNLVVSRQMMAEGKIVATLVVKSGLTELTDRLMWFLSTAGMALIVALALSWLIAVFSQRFISTPLISLAKAADAIAVGNIEQSTDYKSADEIGGLYESFRRLTSYIRELTSAAERVAVNDLTVEITPKSQQDVLSLAFRTMVVNLRSILFQLRDQAQSMVSAGTQISSSAEQMSRGAQEQATRIADVSSAMEEISSTVIESASNASSASDVSRDASTTATAGGQLVSQTIKEMEKIESEVRQSAEMIGKLAKSSEQIGNIVSVISEIADQTNLLALNAAIEAARAGESGRGFAVVADEVRKLADRTAKATGEIAQMVKGIQAETDQAVKSMNSGIQQVHKGRELADKAGDSLSEILSTTQRVANIIHQIAMATEQQSNATEEVSKSVEHISFVTKETAVGAEQSAKTADQLNHQAEALEKLVNRFKLQTT
jgi:methyl-accepting chemotaxis protein